MSAIRVQVEARSERQAGEDIAQLEGLCDRMDQGAFLPVERDVVIQRVIEQIEKVAVLIAPLGVGVADAPPAPTDR